MSAEEFNESKECIEFYHDFEKHSWKIEQNKMTSSDYGNKLEKLSRDAKVVILWKSFGNKYGV